MNRTTPIGPRTRRVVIVGAGYAGALCAARLSRKLRNQHAAAGGNVSIAIVDPRAHFVERVRLHEDVASGALRTRVPLARLLRETDVSIWTGWVREVDLEARRIRIELTEPRASRSEAFDDLVITTGSTAAGDEVPGVMEHAARVGTEEDAIELVARLERAPPNAHVVLCGGGLTGIELATEMAERRRSAGVRVSLVSSSLGASLGERARAHVRASLEAAGVSIVEGAPVVAVERDAVVLADGNVIAADIAVWCAGLRPSSLPRSMGLATDTDGRAIVDANLRSVSHRHVHVAGDAARFELRPDAPLRMACATANPMGAFCADDLARDIAGRRPKRFRFAYALQCASLGRKNAIVQRVDGFDAPRTGTLRGRPAAWFKEGLCRLAIGASALERMGIPYAWPRGRWEPPHEIAAVAPSPKLLSTK